MRILAIFLAIFFIATSPCLAQDSTKLTAVLNQKWLKSVVSIEVLQKKDKAKPIGTGFLVSTSNKHIALITAKHVVFADNGKGPRLKNLAYSNKITKSKKE